MSERMEAAMSAERKPEDGCGNHHCRVADPGPVGLNAGCRCDTRAIITALRAERDALVKENERLKDDNLALQGAYQNCAREHGEERQARARLGAALREIVNELGVPQPGYPMPVANAAEIARAALAPPKETP